MDIDHAQVALWLMFVAGLGVFAFAMRWDLQDPERITRRSDVAFWLHLAAAPLIARIIALQRLLKDPAPAAKRLARHLAQMKARQEPRPICPPIAGTFRLGAELGTVASALPGLVSRAVADWPDTS